MIIRSLATTDCRDGNCPTAWLTDRGTVVVQGYLTQHSARAGSARRGVVEVPEHILVGAAAELLAGGDPAVPMPRRSDETPDVWSTRSGWFAVRGDVSISDVVALPVPEGEGAVDVDADVIIRAASQISAKEAV